MKWYFAVGILAICSTMAFGAGVPVVESPINGYGTPVTVAIASGTLTKVPTSQTSGRLGVYVSLPQGNTGMVGFLGDCTSTAIASTIRPIEISTGTGKLPDHYFPIREDVCLWLISLNTNVLTQNMHYQEIKR
jgi:hypothetical protein